MPGPPSGGPAKDSGRLGWSAPLRDTPVNSFGLRGRSWYGGRELHDGRPHRTSPQHHRRPSSLDDGPWHRAFPPYRRRPSSLFRVLLSRLAI